MIKAQIPGPGMLSFPSMALSVSSDERTNGVSMAKKQEIEKVSLGRFNNTFANAAYAFNQEKEYHKLMIGREENLKHLQKIQEYCAKHNVSATPRRSWKYYLNALKSAYKGKLKVIRVDYVDANGSRKTGFWFTFDLNSWFFFPRIIIPNYSWMKS
jgi:hypothetical protein